MPRSLEIHHIDVGQGESTLILVKNPALIVIGGANPNPDGIEKAVLIDGGLLNQGDVVHQYLLTKNVGRLDIIIATHYDKDHYWGLRSILSRNVAMYDNVVIYDRGEYSTVDHFGNVNALGRDDPFTNYLVAVRSGDPKELPTHSKNTATTKPGRHRITSWVNSFGTTEQNTNNAWSNNAAAAFANARPNLVNGHRVWRKADLLLTQPEILGLPQLNGVNGPTMTCIAANKYARRAAGGNPTFVFGGLSDDDDNPLSLGFEIKFNNFRYFTAGDLSTAQEDYLASSYLNTANNDAGHVCAFKLSHHGSHFSTSDTFIQRIRPRAAFISCGDANSYNHPENRVITTLQNQCALVNNPLQNFYLSSCGGADGQAAFAACNGGNQYNPGTNDRVAGDSANAQAGNIVLDVTEVQSLANPHQFRVTYWDADRTDPLTGNPQPGNVNVAHTC